MHEIDDPLFDVVYSLPVLGCSVALAQRTPAAGGNYQTKYMPDYGGCLETTTSCLKNNSLDNGIPFNIRPKRARIQLNNIYDEQPSDTVINSDNCLIVTSYLDTDEPNQFSVIRLLDSGVTLHSLNLATEGNSDTLQYGHLSFKNQGATGLKHIEARNITTSTSTPESTNNNNYLLVKFTKSLRVYELNRSFNSNSILEESTDECRQTHKQITSIKDRTGYSLKDASLNLNNTNIVALASDNSNIHSIKLFDLETNSRQPFQNIEWETSFNEFPSAETCLLSKELRGRVVRTFIPIRPTNWGTQQLDHIPSHLFNLLVTNEQRISLVDPRASSLAQDYINKSELPSFYPIEYMRRTVFSTRNEYQFYSMTNVHLRVIDTRYPGVPVGQISHMLESEKYNSMGMKIIKYPDCELETLCCSSSSGLCFMSFDRNKFGNLVNPKSTHLPYHETDHDKHGLTEGDPLAFGLSAISSNDSLSDDKLFSIIQLNLKGDLLVRSYMNVHYIDSEQSPVRANLFTDEDGVSPIGNNSTVPIRQTSELPDRNILHSANSPSPQGLIDLSDSSFLDEIERKLESKRALGKFELMRSKLCRA